MKGVPNPQPWRPWQAGAGTYITCVVYQKSMLSIFTQVREKRDVTMQLELLNDSGPCCEFFQGERLVARVLVTYGKAHFAGEFYGMLTLSHAALDNALSALRSWWPVRASNDNRTIKES